MQQAGQAATPGWTSSLSLSREMVGPGHRRPYRYRQPGELDNMLNTQSHPPQHKVRDTQCKSPGYQLIQHLYL